VAVITLSHKIAWNTLIQIIGKGVSVVLGVIITILLTRYLGPAGYGTYTFVLVFVTMFGVIGDWGLSLITVREASKNEKDAQEIISNVFVLRLILAIIAVTASIITIHLLPYSSQIRQLVTIFSFFLIVTSIKTSLQIIFNVKLVMQYWAISEAVANVIYLLLILIIINTSAGIYWIITAAVVDQIASIAVAGVLGARLLPLKLSFKSKYTKTLFWEALPMGGILVLFTIYNRIDTIILSLFKGETAVGYYGAAYKVFEVLTVPAAYFANSVLPVISNLVVTDKQGLVRVYKKCLLALLGMGFTMAVANYFLAPLAIQIIAGPQFTPAIFALQILSLALIASYFNHLNGYTILALGKQWASFFIAVVALVINLILNLIFIPQFSFPAAAFITFLTEGLIVILSLMVVAYEFKNIH
jgi:O-antigen/teichoic acid export membrane protein